MNEYTYNREFFDPRTRPRYPPRSGCLVVTIPSNRPNGLMCTPRTSSSPSTSRWQRAGLCWSPDHQGRASQRSRPTSLVRRIWITRHRSSRHGPRRAISCGAMTPSPVYGTLRRRGSTTAGRTTKPSDEYGPWRQSEDCRRGRSRRHSSGNWYRAGAWRWGPSCQGMKRGRSSPRGLPCSLSAARASRPRHSRRWPPCSTPMSIRRCPRSVQSVRVIL